MSRDPILVAVVVLFIAFEVWGCRADRRLEAWARGDVGRRHEPKHPDSDSDGRAA